MTAPCALPVEARDGNRRAYRLALAIGAEGASFETPLPFEPGSLVNLRFRLPDGQGPFEVRGRAELLGDDAEGDGEHGCMAVSFPEAPRATKELLGHYVRMRLGLTPA